MFREQWMLLFPKSKPWKIEVRSRIENSWCQRPRKSVMLVKDFHGDPNHARVTQNVTQLQNRYLWCPVVLNDRTSSGKQPWLRQRELGLDRVLQSMRDDVIRNLSGAGRVMMSAETYGGLPQSPCLKQRRVKPNITHCQWNKVLRNRKHVPCFYRVIETRGKVWENEKCCGKSRANSLIVLV